MLIIIDDIFNSKFFKNLKLLKLNFSMKILVNIEEFL